MFNLISTKNLYLVELDMITKSQQLDKLTTRYFFANKPRYALARKEHKHRYIDIFTETKYSDINDVGKEMVVRANALITSKKYLNKEDIILILQELNPTYLEVGTSRTRKKIK